MSLAITNLGLDMKRSDGTVTADVNKLKGTEAKDARDVIWDNIDRVELALDGLQYSSLGITDQVCQQWIALLLDLDKKLNDRGASKPYAAVLGRYKKQLNDDAAAATMMMQPFAGANVALAGSPPIQYIPWRNVQPVKKLTADNFDDWKEDLELKLEDEGVLKAIQTQLPDDDRVNKKAYSKLRASIPDELALDVVDTRNAYVAFRLIQKAYGQKDEDRQDAIIEEIKRMKLSGLDHESVNKHLSSFTAKIVRLKSAGASVKVGKYLSLLSATLPSENPFREFGMNLRSYQAISPAMERFRSECQLWHEQGLTVVDHPFESAFMAGSSRKRLRKKIMCYNCWQWSDTHTMRNCPNPTVVKPSNVQSPEPANGASSGDAAFILNRRHLTERVMLSTEKTYLDSGATSHYRQNAGGLSNLRATINSRVTTANGQCCNVSGVGDALYGDLVLRNAKVVPGLSSDLISVSQLDKNFVTVFGNGGASVYRKEGIEVVSRESPVLTATLVDGLYECNKNEAASMCTEESSVERALMLKPVEQENTEKLQTKETAECDQLREQLQKREDLVTRLVQQCVQLKKDNAKLEENLRAKDGQMNRQSDQLILAIAKPETKLDGRLKCKPSGGASSGSSEDSVVPAPATSEPRNYSGKTQPFRDKLKSSQVDPAADSGSNGTTSGRLGDAAIGGCVATQGIASSLAAGSNRKAWK